MGHEQGLGEVGDAVSRASGKWETRRTGPRGNGDVVSRASGKWGTPLNTPTCAQWRYQIRVGKTQRNKGWNFPKWWKTMICISKKLNILNRINTERSTSECIKVKWLKSKRNEKFEGSERKATPHHRGSPTVGTADLSLGQCGRHVRVPRTESKKTVN